MLLHCEEGRQMAPYRAEQGRTEQGRAERILEGEQQAVSFVDLLGLRMERGRRGSWCLIARGLPSETVGAPPQSGRTG